jgi:hypothetical protein
MQWRVAAGRTAVRNTRSSKVYRITAHHGTQAGNRLKRMNNYFALYAT